MNETIPSQAEFTMPAGTLCHCSGLPFELVSDTVIRTNPRTWELMQVNGGRPFRSLEESQAFGRIVEAGTKD